MTLIQKCENCCSFLGIKVNKTIHLDTALLKCSINCRNYFERNDKTSHLKIDSE